ncbi:MAG: hypothetical protein CMI16_03010 [Opitutaceae bacterium]|nr:hypothetical protein [Opitutaceae bacterium]
MPCPGVSDFALDPRLGDAGLPRVQERQLEEYALAAYQFQNAYNEARREEHVLRNEIQTLQRQNEFQDQETDRLVLENDSLQNQITMLKNKLAQAAGGAGAATDAGAAAAKKPEAAAKKPEATYAAAVAKKPEVTYAAVAKKPEASARAETGPTTPAPIFYRTADQWAAHRKAKEAEKAATTPAAKVVVEEGAAAGVEAGARTTPHSGGEESLMAKNRRLRTNPGAERATGGAGGAAAGGADGEGGAAVGAAPFTVDETEELKAMKSHQANILESKRKTEQNLDSLKCAQQFASDIDLANATANADPKPVRDYIQQKFKEKALLHHSDKGGNDGLMSALNKANTDLKYQFNTWCETDKSVKFEDWLSNEIKRCESWFKTSQTTLYSNKAKIALIVANQAVAKEQWTDALKYAHEAIDHCWNWRHFRNSKVTDKILEQTVEEAKAIIDDIAKGGAEAGVKAQEAGAAGAATSADARAPPGSAEPEYDPDEAAALKNKAHHAGKYTKRRQSRREYLKTLKDDDVVAGGAAAENRNRRVEIDLDKNTYHDLKQRLRML